MKIEIKERLMMRIKIEGKILMKMKNSVNEIKGFQQKMDVNKCVIDGQRLRW